MYLCYLDESGVVEHGGNSDCFVLLGFAIPADTWKEKDSQINLIKDKYGLKDIEIHTAWMMRDYPEQKTIPTFESLSWHERRKAVLGVRSLNLARATRKYNNELRKNYKKTDSYVHLNRSERYNCVKEIAECFSKWSDLRLFCDVHSKKHLEEIDHYQIAFEQVVTRFNTYLNIAAGRLGILVQDNNQTVARRITKVMRMYHSIGTLWSKIENIVETPLFVDSQLTSMVQLSDMCAYVTRRYFEKNENTLFDIIRQNFDRSHGNIVGLRHYTGKFQCKCDICIAHGRS